MRKNYNQVLAVNGMNDRVTDVIAVGALTSPWWLPDLATISTISGTLIPILSLIWLVVQILSKLNEWHTKWLGWRVKREHARYKKIHNAIERQKEYDQTVESTRNRTGLDGSGSGVPGDQGDSWTETQQSGGEVGSGGKQREHQG